MFNLFSQRQLAARKLSDLQLNDKNHFSIDSYPA
jgi:hypothetical protein